MQFHSVLSLAALTPKMSKKIFLRKSYADALKGKQFDDDFGKCLTTDDGMEEGLPGESLIKPELCTFKYHDCHIRASVNAKAAHPKTSPKKRPATKCRYRVLEEEIDDIIEILSSPEKSPFKDNNSCISVSSDRSSISEPSVKRIRKTIFAEENGVSFESRPQPIYSDSDSLPSIDEALSPKASDDNAHTKDFTKYPGKCFFNLYDCFSTLNRGLTSSEILEVLLHPENFNICANVPQYVQEPSAFLFNTDDLNSRKDIRADGNGVWKIKNRPKRNFKIEENGKVTIIKDPSLSESEKCFQVVRSYSYHKETPTFRRLIIELENSPFVILQFYFIGEVIPVTLKPHGNSKATNAAPYRRVSKSTLDRITEMAKCGKSSKSVMKNIVDEHGGIENVEANSVPRNDQQVKNLKRKFQTETSDDVQEILHAFDSQKNNFIRKVDIRPDFVVVLASDQQLTDLQRFCTKQPFGILGIDPTFHFGDFDVTVTTYRHKMLQDNSSKKVPVFVGPVCVHKKKDTQTYYNFLSTLIAKENELRNMKAIGTDGEIALSNATLMAFENAIQLRCFNHVKKNITNKLRDMGVTKQGKRTIIADIFGTNDNELLTVAGLVDCYTHAEFDQKLDTLKDKWNVLVSEFWTWFKNQKSETFKDHMIQSVRSKAGLAKCQTYTTNDNESINSALQRVCGKRQTLPKFVQELEDFIQSQNNQVHLAVVQQGNYRFRCEYREMEIPMQLWSKLSSSDRQKHIAKVQRCPIRNEITTLKGNETVMTMNKNLSISVEQSGIRDTPNEILNDMWEKAELLLRKNFSICEVPDYPDCRRVMSLSNPKSCHFVEYCKKSGNIKCDCYLQKLHKICHHVLAVAEEIGVLIEYIKWRKLQKTSYNLTSAVNSKLPKTAGKKPNERRNWSKNKNKVFNQTAASIVDPFPIDAENSYIFRFLQNTKIMVCYGCGEKFRKSIQELPCAPYDLVLAKKEYRRYVNEFGELKMSLKREFVHYHIKKSCVQKKDYSFDVQTIVVTDTVRSALKEEHREFIKLKLGLHI